MRGQLYSRGGPDQIFDTDGIDAFITALINHLNNIPWTDQRKTQLKPAGSPASGDRQLPGRKGHLISGYTDGLQ